MKIQFAAITQSWFYFAFIWLCAGFASGTLILLFPLRWWINTVRANQFAEIYERLGVIGFILLLFLLSFWLSRKLFNWQKQQQRLVISFISGFFPLVFALAALMLLLQPQFINTTSEQQQVSQQFTIGSYPTEEKIKELKAEGYTGIISLLHTAVVPFEPVLLAQEKAAALKYDIKLVEAPMLPWVSDNTASLKIIEGIIRTNQGKYYIHCYLGKDRVNLVRNLISRLAGEALIEAEAHTARRTFEQMGNFERGDLYRLSKDIYLTPYPTKEEFLAFFLAGNVKTVVNLLDSTDVDDQKRIVEERDILKNGAIDFKNYTFHAIMPQNELLAMVDSVLKLPKPIVIHHWNTTCPEAVLFMKLYTQKTKQIPLNLAKPDVRTH